MAVTIDEIELYEQLAQEYHQQGKYQERDRFLLLAADAAQRNNRIDEAERLRSRILTINPNHLLKAYSTFGDALSSQDIQAYLKQLRQRYPKDQALQLLKKIQQTTTPAKGLEKESQDIFTFEDSTDDLPSPTVQTPMAKGDKQMSQLPPNWQQPTSGSPGSQPIANPFGGSYSPASSSANPPFEAEITAGAWIGGLLFVVLFLIGLAVFGVTFVWPFVQNQF